jgi:hypothetical protein
MYWSVLVGDQLLLLVLVGRVSQQVVLLQMLLLSQLLVLARTRLMPLVLVSTKPQSGGDDVGGAFEVACAGQRSAVVADARGQRVAHGDVAAAVVGNAVAVGVLG